ncbi:MULTISPECIES: hypothetical protein [unclassified Streptomyces]|uniref:hypothetical protein n=1 Tax=unclassified Streptomyces TaxID=2593676 RepID=UPI002E2D86EE|nr:hypothetical protein [Streptomyces sp. NBC_00272]
MSHRTIRTRRLKSATMVSAGVLAVALNVVPATTAIADAIHRSGTDTAVALPGPSGVMGDDDHGGQRGPQGRPGRPGHDGRPGRDGAQGPQGYQGASVGLVTYVNTASDDDGSVIATCETGDRATGGGLLTATGNVRTSRPVGTPPNGWQAEATTAQDITAYVVCADVTP